jgi:hypothetical protein
MRQQLFSAEIAKVLRYRFDSSLKCLGCAMRFTLMMFVLLSILACASCQEVRKVSVRVIDERGMPLDGVSATVTFMGHTARATQREVGQTGANGVFHAQGTPHLRIYVNLEKDGYYPSESGRLSKDQDHNLVLILRDRKNPIPLHAKRYRGRIPGLGKEFGFDFKEGDWVAPFGDGRVADLSIRADIGALADGSPSGLLRVSFPQEFEGVFVVNEDSGYLPGSQLVMPHLAPEIGYEMAIEREEASYEDKAKPNNTSYFFRTRGIASQSGVKTWNYSKMHAGIDFVMGGGVFLEEPYRSIDPKEYAIIGFQYYFNPTPGDRNLEFDPSKNLLGGLTQDEQVIEP